MEYFRCYSKPFHQFLDGRHIRYIIVAKDIVNGKTFWLYEQSENFRKVADAWRLNRPE